MTDKIRHQLLDEALLSTADASGRRREMFSLPALYAALVRRVVADFPALRPHQRHVWHAFLVQVGALALHRAGLTELPDDADVWRTLLLALTPDDSAWALIAPGARPALLQAPVVEATSRWDLMSSPDELDILVTSKNHDVKRAVIANARPEHWIYALVSLQTQEGYAGATKHGVSRMNTGKGNRPGVGITVAGGPSARIVRDIKRLLRLRSSILTDYEFFKSTGGLGLLWLEPWDGMHPLRAGSLDPFFVEICRRVRLLDRGGQICAVATGTAKLKVLGQRIAADSLRGDVGDPWTPVATDEIGPKAYTLSAPGFTYDRMRALVLPTANDQLRRAPLQVVAPTDPDDGLVLLARGLVRGDVTEGYYEREIPISKVLRPFLTTVPSDMAANCAKDRSGDVGVFVKNVLRPALQSVFTGAPHEQTNAREKDRSLAIRIRTGVSVFERTVDATFFADLDAELTVLDDLAARDVIRAAWLVWLRDVGRDVLRHVLDSAPSASMRHYRTRVRARNRFDAAFRRHFGHRLTHEGTAGTTSETV